MGHDGAPYGLLPFPSYNKFGISLMEAPCCCRYDENIG